MSKQPKIGVTSGLRGHFAVLYDSDGPIQTGETCETRDEAVISARCWAEADELTCDFDEQQR